MVAVMRPRLPVVAGCLGLVASLDGRVLYALGRRSKSESLAVFVSRDGGATFDAGDHVSFMSFIFIAANSVAVNDVPCVMAVSGA